MTPTDTDTIESDIALLSEASAFDSQTQDDSLGARIMIIDDEEFNILVVRRYLQLAGYTNFVTLSDSTKAIEMIRDDPPDLLLLDIMMPEVSGLDLLRSMRMHREMNRIPVLILTAASEAKIKRECLDLHATDFLAKPVDANDLVPRVKNALLVKKYQDQLEIYAEELEAQVERRTTELAESRQQIIHCLARAGEFRDNDTGHHVLRVGKFAGVIAAELGFNEQRVELLELATQLHDVGKIAIPDSILLNPGRLDPEQYELMKKHCAHGKRILQPLGAVEAQTLRHHARLGAELIHVPSSPLLMLASQIAQTHHEWWDGTGYPLGLAGNDIPIEGRIAAVADVYDALSSERPYKDALPRERCFEIMKENRATQFDPEILDAFFRCSEAVIAVQLEYMDP